MLSMLYDTNVDNALLQTSQNGFLSNDITNCRQLIKLLNDIIYLFLFKTVHSCLQLYIIIQ